MVIAAERVGFAAKASNGRPSVLETMVQFAIGKACEEEKWMAEIRDPRKGVRVWLGTFNTTKEAARAYDRECRKIHGKKVKARTLNLNLEFGYDLNHGGAIGVGDAINANPFVSCVDENFEYGSGYYEVEKKNEK
ncbi:hypothetical protein HN51_041276 [Arachis hypogaea]